MSSYSYWSWRILACYATYHSPFSDVTHWSQNLPFRNFSPFVTVGVLGVSGCFSEIYGLGNRPSLRLHSVLSGNGIYLVSGVHFVYISCVYMQHTIFIIIHAHTSSSFDDSSCWHQYARAKILLAREVLCSRGKYYARAGNTMLAWEYSLSRKIIFVQHWVQGTITSPKIL